MKNKLIKIEKIFSYGLIIVGCLLSGYTVGVGHSVYKLKPAYNVDRFCTQKDSADYHITTYYKSVEGFDFVDSVNVEKCK